MSLFNIFKGKEDNADKKSKDEMRRAHNIPKEKLTLWEALIELQKKKVAECMELTVNSVTDEPMSNRGKTTAEAYVIGKFISEHMKSNKELEDANERFRKAYPEAESFIPDAEYRFEQLLQISQSVEFDVEGVEEILRNIANQIDSESHSITISDYSSNKTAFDEVVKMFCDEILKQLGIKITPKEFIFESQFKDKKGTRFTFPIPTKLSDEEKLLFDVVKKNVQLKIKGVKNYEGINLIGVKKMFINSSEIVSLWNIIKNDEHLCNFDGPLFLNLQILFYTCEFDYDRFTDFAKQLDKHLNITKVDYVDIKKRVIDAVDEVSSIMHNDLSKKTGISKNQCQGVIKDMGKQGAVKLIYMRNYTWDIEDIKEPADLVKKLSSLMRFMQSTLKSEGEHKDFLIPIFELSTDVDFVSAYGCFATINDKTGLDDSIFRIEIPNRMKEL